MPGGAGSAEVRLLGEVEVWRGGKLVPAGQPRQRSVLAALAVDAGRHVSLDALVYRVWGESPPNGVRGTIYAYITRLRQVLGAPPESPILQHLQRGYVLRLHRHEVDLHHFRDLAVLSRGAELPARAQLLREALDLWRGEPLAGLTGHWAAQMRQAWQEERLDAMIAWAESEQGLGRPGIVIGQLTEAVSQHPLVEPLAAQLVRALWAAGRPAQALERFGVTRRLLLEELGTEPGDELRQLHQQILHAGGGADLGAGQIPAQVPRDIASFSGREPELSWLDAVARPPGDRVASVMVVSGTAGIGKTTLAVHWAHRVAGRFPDGQLYLNLRGFDPGGAPVDPSAAIRSFLDALDVAPQRIPADLDAQAALYRSRMAGRRMLVVLDNARNDEQVRPLLPAAPGCAAVVTSRHQLHGLVAEGAHQLTLDPLSARESLELLTRRLGQSRVAAEPRAVAEIIAYCSRLPLAMAIVAARATTRHGLALADFASELAGSRSRLDALNTGDVATGIRAVFSWSYHSVSPAAARLFRLMALAPGPEVSVAAAVSLAGQPPERVRGPLTELVQANLVSEPRFGRYTMHDLLRAYAEEQVRLFDSETERDSAVHRLLDHYLHTAKSAARLISPHREELATSEPQPGAVVGELADEEQAHGWLDAERQVLLGAIDFAVGTRWEPYTWQLGWVVADYLYLSGYWLDQLATGRAAVRAAQRCEGPQAQALTHVNLGRAHLQLGVYDRARHHLRRALELTDEAGDAYGEANAHHSLSWVLERQGEHTEAFGHAMRALELYHRHSDLAGQASALNTIGWFHTQLGQHEQALAFCQQALYLHHRRGHRQGQAATLHSLGFAHHHLGEHRYALVCYRHALSAYSLLQNRYSEGFTLACLGDVYEALGDTAAAVDSWRAGLAILDDINHPQAEPVRGKLLLHSQRFDQ